MRRDEAALGIEPGVGRAGGGIRPDGPEMVGLGGGGIADARCALFAAGNEGTEGDGGLDAPFFFSLSLPLSVKEGTSPEVLTGSAFGVLSPSTDSGSSSVISGL